MFRLKIILVLLLISGAILAQRSRACYFYLSNPSAINVFSKCADKEIDSETNGNKGDVMVLYVHPSGDSSAVSFKRFCFNDKNGVFNHKNQIDSIVNNLTGRDGLSYTELYYITLSPTGHFIEHNYICYQNSLLNQLDTLKKNDLYTINEILNL